MPLPTKILTLTITCRAKLLNADWLRKRAFFLNHEGAFGHQEGMITWYWLAEHARRSPTLLIPHVLWRKAWYKDLPSLRMNLFFHTNSFIISSYGMHFLLCEKGTCIQAGFVKLRHRYGQVATIKMALQNKLSFYFFQIITQENFPRPGMIFNILLHTHDSLCSNHRF